MTTHGSLKPPTHGERLYENTLEEDRFVHRNLDNIRTMSDSLTCKYPWEIKEATHVANRFYLYLLPCYRIHLPDAPPTSSMLLNWTADMRNSQPLCQTLDRSTRTTTRSRLRLQRTAHRWRPAAAPRKFRKSLENTKKKNYYYFATHLSATIYLVNHVTPTLTLNLSFTTR